MSFDLTPAGQQFEGLGNITISSLVASLIGLVLVAGALLAFFLLVFGGIEWLSSGGDAEKTKSAKKKITNALIGLLILFAIWALFSLLGLFFGIEILNLRIPALGEITSGISGGNSGASGGILEGMVGSNCPCGGGGAGYCALIGQVGRLVNSPSSSCYICTSNGWELHGSGCSVISCSQPCN